jgi:hypothetical protein
MVAFVLIGVGRGERGQCPVEAVALAEVSAASLRIRGTSARVARPRAWRSVTVWRESSTVAMSR